MKNLLPYEITLFSNLCYCGKHRILIYYLMKLHYSQTLFERQSPPLLIYYLMKLHYSQTIYFIVMWVIKFTTL